MRRIEAAGVFADELADCRIVPAQAVVVEFRVGIPFAAGVGEQRVVGAARLAHNVAEAVVDDVVRNRRRVRAAGVVGPVPHGPLLVGQRPQEAVGRALVGEDLVDLGAVQVTVGDRAAAIGSEHDVVSVVGVPLAAVEHVVAVGHLFGLHAAGSLERHQRQPVAMVPSCDPDDAVMRFTGIVLE